MQKGVVKVVITDTATMIGYKKSLVTPRLLPMLAMMKENSPICTKLKPQCMAVFRLLPAANTPQMEKNICPKIVTSTRTMTGTMYCESRAGLTSMPTETKKTAPNKFLMGATSCSMRSASGASAIREPMINAPRAEEKPSLLAITTMPRHRPIETITRVSSFIKLLQRLKKLGTRYMPSTNHKTKKNIRRPMLSKSSLEEIPLLATAKVESSTIMAMPAISSMIRMPKTGSVKGSLRSFKSSKALMMMAVEDIESITPKKRLSILLQPKRPPTA